MYDETKVVLRDRREMLRVKLKSLAEEARIIRREERRTWGVLRDELHLHRVTVVRHEARCTHLAYGLIRGRTLQQMERRDTLDPGCKSKVEAMLKKYGSGAPPAPGGEPPRATSPSSASLGAVA